MLILNGISTDMACMKKDAEAEKKAIMDFICKCGLVGMTTAPPIALKLIDYEDRDSLEDAHTGVYHKVMASFDGNVPSYHIELHD